MEKCVESVQIWIKCINVEEKVVGFFGEEMCWRSSTAIAFCNDIEHVRPCWMFRTWQPPSSPSTTSCDRIWFCHNLNPRSSSSNFFLAFSIISFMPINGAEWPLPLQCFPCVFDVAFSFYGSSPLCWFDDYDLFWGFWVWSRKVWTYGYNLTWEWRISGCIHLLLKEHLQSALELWRGRMENP